MVNRSKPPKGYIVFTEELYAEVLEQLESEIAEHLVKNYVFKEGFIKVAIDKWEWIIKVTDATDDTWNISPKFLFKK